MNDEQRAAIRAAYLDGEDDAEIARRAGVSPGETETYLRWWCDRGCPGAVLDEVPGEEATTHDGDYWLFDNNQGGIHVAPGRDARDAKGFVLDSIAESFTNDGHRPRAARRGAHNYGVRLIAGPLTHDQAEEARAAWEASGWETALRHARPHVRRAYGLPPTVRDRPGQLLDELEKADEDDA